MSLRRTAVCVHGKPNTVYAAWELAVSGSSRAVRGGHAAVWAPQVQLNTAPGMPDIDTEQPAAESNNGNENNPRFLSNRNTS